MQHCNLCSTTVRISVGFGLHNSRVKSIVTNDLMTSSNRNSVDDKWARLTMPSTHRLHKLRNEDNAITINLIRMNCLTISIDRIISMLFSLTSFHVHDSLLNNGINFGYFTLAVWLLFSFCWRRKVSSHSHMHPSMASHPVISVCGFFLSRHFPSLASFVFYTIPFSLLTPFVCSPREMWIRRRENQRDA